ncbi:MAG: alpha/beta fold hydrolase [Hydrogenovibrio sp.]
MRHAFQHTLNLSAFLLLALLGTSSQANYTTPAIALNDGQAPTIHYHAIGKPQAPLVIVLGGGPAFSSWNLEPIQQQIAQHGYLATLTDMQGLGENPQTPPHILTGWVTQINRLKTHLSPHQPAILVGHSWGALMAMLYTREHPNAVAKLILLNPVDPEKKSMQQLTDEIHHRNHQEQDQQAFDTSEAMWDNRIPENIDLEAITLRQIHQVLPTYFYDYALGLEYAQQFTAQDFDIDLNVNAWKEYDANPIQYAQIPKTLPKYFMDCTHDYLMPYNLNAMQAHWAFKQTAVFERCGHFPWIEAPKAFNEALQGFLEE